ncbi:MAG: hypothetical protein FWE38_00940 [Firmicutes bacterium]|nr:hypothetical protein [Bacillota bacterium]
MEVVRIVFEFEGQVVLNNEVLLTKSPAAIDWPRFSDILVNNEIWNTAKMLKITDKIFLCRIKRIPKYGEMKMVTPNIATDGKRSVFIEDEKYYDLGVIYREAPPPIMFLQHVQFKEFESAKRMLGFDISDKLLTQFFGDFEILLNNYMDDKNVFSIVKKGQVQNLSFVIENGIIKNII